jgi:hypothetical protein
LLSGINMCEECRARIAGNLNEAPASGREREKRREAGRSGEGAGDGVRVYEELPDGSYRELRRIG